MSKIFDPNRCPYAQLLEHKGIASILAEDYSLLQMPGNDPETDPGTTGRFRVVSYRKGWVKMPGRHASHVYWNGTASLQRTLFESQRGGEVHPSYRTASACYAEYSRGGYKECIRAMKDYDKRKGIKITFIFFH